VDRLLKSVTPELHDMRHETCHDETTVRRLHHFRTAAEPRSTLPVSSTAHPYLSSILRGFTYLLTYWGQSNKFHVAPQDPLFPAGLSIRVALTFLHLRLSFGSLLCATVNYIYRLTYLRGGILGERNDETTSWYGGRDSGLTGSRR